MATLQEILARAQALREETALGSIDPERAGGIMYDTLQQINQLQLAGGLVISKIYASVAAMQADSSPVSDLTGAALKPGRLVVIVPSDQSSAELGSVYRFDGISSGASSWSFVGKIGGYPMDQTPTPGSTRAVTSDGVYDQITQLGQKLNQVAHEITNMSGKFYGVFSSSENLPTGDEEGYAYVGAVSPFAVWFFDGTEWSDSGSTMDAISGAAENPFKGYYATISALSAAYPSPISGNYAYVNVGNSVVHLYDVQNGIWHDTNIVISNSVEGVFSNYAKMELLATLEKVAWIDGNGQTYLDTLRSILIGDVQVVGISAVFDSGDIKIVDTASLDYLKNFLTVTAELSDGTHGEITGYSLTGKLSVGTCTITVEYGQLSTTFSVDVIANLAAPLDNWTYQPYTRGGVCRYNGEAIEMKCGTAADVTSWSIWTIDNKKTMWSAVIGKTIKIRIKCSHQPYNPGIIRAGLGIYQSNSITSLGAAYSRRAGSNWVLADDGYWEDSIVCDLANFPTGTLTPGENATFGLYAYSQSNTEYGYIYDVQMYEVTE